MFGHTGISTHDSEVCRMVGLQDGTFVQTDPRHRQAVLYAMLYITFFEKKTLSFGEGVWPLLVLRLGQTRALC